jgi:excisionase family DNA binding protein
MENKFLYTIPEITGLLGISRTKVYQLIKAGELPVVRIGRSVRIYRPELQEWLEGIANAHRAGGEPK